MNENDVIIPVSPEPTDLVVEEKDLSLIVAEAEKRVAILKQVLGVAISRTNHSDWVDQQGKPYLTCPGAEKIAPLFQIVMTNLMLPQRTNHEDDKGSYYIYTCTATFTWRGGSIQALGTCSSRDKFFAWDKEKQEYKILSDIDETNIKKASYSNMYGNGITRLLGIRNLQWEDLKAFGIDKEKVQSIKYQKTAKDVSEEDKTKQSEIATMLLEISNNDQKQAEALLKQYTQFTAKDGTAVQGVSSPKMLTGMRLNICHSTVKKQYEIYKKNFSETKE